MLTGQVNSQPPTKSLRRIKLTEQKAHDMPGASVLGVTRMECQPTNGRFKEIELRSSILD